MPKPWKRTAPNSLGKITKTTTTFYKTKSGTTKVEERLIERKNQEKEEIEERGKFSYQDHYNWKFPKEIWTDKELLALQKIGKRNAEIVSRDYAQLKEIMDQSKYSEIKGSALLSNKVNARHVSFFAMRGDAINQPVFALFKLDKSGKYILLTKLPKNVGNFSLRFNKYAIPIKVFRELLITDKSFQEIFFTRLNNDKNRSIGSRLLFKKKLISYLKSINVEPTDCDITNFAKMFSKSELLKLGFDKWQVLKIRN